MRVEELICETRSPTPETPIFILGKDALIRNKQAVGHPQDLADLESLK